MNTVSHAIDYAKTSELWDYLLMEGGCGVLVCCLSQGGSLSPLRRAVGMPQAHTGKNATSIDEYPWGNLGVCDR